MPIGPEDVGKIASMGSVFAPKNPVSVSVSVYYLRVYRVEDIVVVEDKFSQGA